MRSVVLVLVSCLTASAGCVGSDHDALAARDAGTGGNAGSGGAIVDAAGEKEAAPLDGDQHDAVSEAAPSLDSSFGPDGPSVFTFVHGLADARNLRVCFHAAAGNQFQALDVPPSPDDPAGLPYAASLSGSTLPGNIDLAVTDVRPVIYFGELDAIAGLDCSQLLSPPALVQASSLAVIPAGTLTKQRSVLMVVAGCVGGQDHVDSNQEAICGKGYATDKPTARLLMASVDRVSNASAIGLQVFIGSLSSGSFTVDHLVSVPSKTTPLASGLLSGDLEPRPPKFALSQSDLGTDLGANWFRLFVDQTPEPGRIAYLSEALARGGLAIGDFVNGTNFTVVVVGPRPDVPEGAWWQQPELTVVRNDP